jgi:glutathione S-transferase
VFELGFRRDRDISKAMKTEIETLDVPLLYSFRRCPYAIRARLALASSGCLHAVREVVLRDKPAEMITASAKATVPVLVLPDGRVLEESLMIMDWALAQNDPDNWLAPQNLPDDDSRDLIAECESPFKHHLDRYKYAVRYDDADPEYHRGEGEKFLQKLDKRLKVNRFLSGDSPSLADFAICPFIRQFANTDRSWFDGLDYPALHTWLQGQLNSKLFQGVMKRWPKWEPGMTEPRLPSENLLET